MTPEQAYNAWVEQKVRKEGNRHFLGYFDAAKTGWQAALAWKAEQAQPSPERYLVRAKFTDEIEVYLTVTGVHKVTPTTVGIDVEMPDYCSSPVAQSCLGNDPLCPCQDGDQCHYRDSGKTKAWKNG